MYVEPGQTSEMDFFEEIDNDGKSVAIFPEIFVLEF